MGRCATRATLSVAVTGAALCGCGPSLPKVDPAANANDSNHVALRLFGYDETQAQYIQRVSGRLFLLSYDPSMPQRLIWVDCAAPASYTYQSDPNTTTKDEEFEDEADLRAHLGLNVVNLSGYLRHGSKLHVRYFVSGSYTVDQNVKVPRACKAANYFVALFSVGAYVIDTMGENAVGIGATAYDQGGEANAGNASLGHTMGGNLDACKPGSSQSPVNECSTPLTLLLVPISPNQWSDDAPTSTDPDPTPHIPTGGAVQTVTDVHSPLHKRCYHSLAYTGDALADVALVGDRCGHRLGLVPVGPPIANHQAGTDPPQKFTVNLEGGACYRLFTNADSAVTDVQTRLVDPDGNVVTQSEAGHNHAVLDPDGPFCVERSGAYSLILSVVAGEGRYAVQLWKMPRHD